MPPMARRFIRSNTRKKKSHRRDYSPSTPHRSWNLEPAASGVRLSPTDADDLLRRLWAVIDG